MSFSIVIFLIISYTQGKILINRQFTIQEVDDNCLVVKHDYVGFSGCQETASDTSLPPLSKYIKFNSAGGTPVKLTQSKPLLVEGQQQSSWSNRAGAILGAIFGADSRTKVRDSTVAPYSGVGQISDDCTGAKIGPRHILTAAHCVDRMAYDVNWNFAPGKDGQYYKPFGEYKWIVAYVPDEYLNRGRYFFEYDYAIVILQEDLNDDIETFKFDFECNHPSATLELNIVGFPDDKPKGTMWKTGCSNLYVKCDWKYFSHKCDTRPGMSGSPMFAEVQRDDGTIDKIIYGVHTGAFTTHNIAIVMSTVVQEQLKEWLQIFSPQTQINGEISDAVTQSVPQTQIYDQIAPVSEQTTKNAPVSGQTTKSVPQLIAES